jgi:hypothetical protein
LEKQLGPEYLALVDALFNNNNMDLNSEDFEEIVSMFDRFDEACRPDVRLDKDFGALL